MTDLNINPETGASTNTGASGRSPRLTLWIAFLVFSTITLGASVEVVSEPFLTRTRAVDMRAANMWS